jgi:hypothetical protein
VCREASPGEGREGLRPSRPHSYGLPRLALVKIHQEARREKSHCCEGSQAQPAPREANQTFHATERRHRSRYDGGGLRISRDGGASDRRTSRTKGHHEEGPGRVDARHSETRLTPFLKFLSNKIAPADGRCRGFFVERHSLPASGSV